MFCVATVQRGRVKKISDVMRENIFDAIGDANDIWRKVGGDLSPECPIPNACVVIAEYRGAVDDKSELVRCSSLRRVKNDQFDCLYANVDGDTAIVCKVRSVNAS